MQESPLKSQNTAALFNTVLVANRGEIACRVIRTLRTMGITSVAVYSDADAGARHVREADTAVRIGPAAASASYLNTDAIIAACRSTGAQAVHPGYGFLSENVEFASALEAAGIMFIGPGVESLNVMGDKIRSKNHVSGYGVPVVPGIAAPGLSDAQLIEAASSVGFPLLIKPSAGGGGKGMHAVQRAEDLASTLLTARRVAASAFGDDTLFLERLVLTPRHIEVQILADNYGNVIHLGERECSLQRRHQKVIEEAPSPMLESLPRGEEIRAKLGEAACNAARSVNYSGAGTVEFLVSDAAPDEFFFMEMNTRLQVEHPVTEMITGLDLVQWQVKIAAGEHLTIKQEDIQLNGHSVEARVYAEVPERNFMPSTGTVQLLNEDASAPPGTLLRMDSALLNGLEISADYDPMVAKVISWAPDRQASLDALDAGLSHYLALGIDTNVEYLRLLINDPDVRAGKLDTGLIERKMPDFAFRHVGEAEVIVAALMSWVHSTRKNQGSTGRMSTGSPSVTTGTPWNRLDGWRMGARAPWRLHVLLPDGQLAEVSVTSKDSQTLSVSVDDEPAQECSIPEIVGQRVRLTISSATHEWAFATDAATYSQQNQRIYLGSEGWQGHLDILGREAYLHQRLASIERESGTADPEVHSPMPGTVVSVAVVSGQEVQAGQPLVSVEAMKMEHQLLAAVDGIVHLSVKTGEIVKADQVLATIHPITDNDVTTKE
ncbi:acetyl/propionyl/methylcrotonyl-CoA carboxylase subunit alpha [Pseudarthrobacter sp. J1763]|uniref:acetyl/propionyl/methylcrotonyl-CoA carboxylase subunit alpha n=1 Tax=Pseudarthrobacter sp. J1763 TaxID=3420445 RepID=UPI003D28D683